ncbi:hypothetical protein Tco_1198391, partial [Tanacetum coccineum]
DACSGYSGDLSRESGACSKASDSYTGTKSIVSDGPLEPDSDVEVTVAWDED